jgi:RNA polymerase sigma-70 factor (ECF subfamily)
LAALAVLKERDREALTLVAWDGLTPVQAAAVLGEPSARFRQRLHRAGRRLRAELDADLAAELRREAPTAPRHEHAPTGGPA